MATSDRFGNAAADAIAAGPATVKVALTTTAPLLAGLRPACESQACDREATHGLVFVGHCRCTPTRTGAWLLCLPHVEKGLRVLRDPVGTVGTVWRCDRCGAVGFHCTPTRVEPLAAA